MLQMGVAATGANDRPRKWKEDYQFLFPNFLP